MDKCTFCERSIQQNPYFYDLQKKGWEDCKQITDISINELKLNRLYVSPCCDVCHELASGLISPDARQSIMDVINFEVALVDIRELLLPPEPSRNGHNGHKIWYMIRNYLLPPVYKVVATEQLIDLTAETINSSNLKYQQTQLVKMKIPTTYEASKIYDDIFNEKLFRHCYGVIGQRYDHINVYTYSVLTNHEIMCKGDFFKMYSLIRSFSSSQLIHTVDLTKIFKGKHINT